jgi:uncharacterized phage-associated protein
MNKNLTVDIITLGETKLQKLLYICDGYLLAANIDFIKEQAKAWNYGPVYPRVHNWIERDPDVFNKAPQCSPEAFKEIGKTEVEPLVDWVIGYYGPWTSSQLSAWSHGPGSPWELALERGKGVMNSVIDKQDMKKYFLGIISDAQRTA